MPKKTDNSAKLEAVFKLIPRGELEEIRDALRIEGDTLVKASGKKNGDYLVTVAARHGRVDVLTFLKQDLLASLEVANHDGKRPIHEAAQYGHVRCVAYLIEAGVDVDALKRATWTPLMLACTKDNMEVIRVLIEQGGATYATLKNKDGWTCFHIACREGHVDVLRYFLRLNGNLWQTRSNVGRTPLHTAALNGQVDAVGFLLDVVSSEELNRGDVCGATPLTDAIKGGHAIIVTLLLEAQKSRLPAVLLTEFDSLGRLPLDLAAMFGNLEIFLTILRVTICVSTDCNSEVGGLPKLPPHDSPISSCEKVLLHRNKDRGRTPLHYAAMEGQVSIVEWIVDRLKAEGVFQAEVFGMDYDGKSPLDLALRGQHQQTVNILRVILK